MSPPEGSADMAKSTNAVMAQVLKHRQILGEERVWLSPWKDRLCRSLVAGGSRQVSLQQLRLLSQKVYILVHLPTKPFVPLPSLHSFVLWLMNLKLLRGSEHILHLMFHLPPD